ncbi:MAG: flagellar biosynthesis protein FlhF [Clostridium sp.]|nr:flagellar biosynthesis protein FlhF [Clostridium sp.]
MIIKKFQGKTEAEAVEAAKKELGENVVVMNVRSVKRKGAFSLFLPQLTEITVAKEEEERAAVKKEALIPKPLVEAIERSTTADLSAIRDQLPPLQENTGLARLARQSSARVEETANNKGEEWKDNSVIQEKLDSLHDLLEQQLQKPEEPKAEAAEEEKESELERFMKLLYNTMLDNEVSEQYANQIIDEMEKISKQNLPFDYVLANIYQKMILKFGKPVEITPAKKGPKAVFFVGPTGVGKTTTIAKIASKFSMEKKKTVLLTADTYRIAATEQLRTYANILEIPFRVIYSADEMEKALQDFREYDFIMVDTAGHSHQNKEQRENTTALLRSLDDAAEKEVFLVLSATTKYRDLLKIADTYMAMTEFALIFTKLDETTSLGNLLNIKLYTGAPLSYVTCGQNVPDDIENFNPQKTVKQLLGGKKG